MADGEENQQDVQRLKSSSMEESQGQNLASEHDESSDQRRETEPENRENGVSGLRANGNSHHDSRERRHEQESRSMREKRPIRDRDPRQRREAQEMQLAWGSSIQNASVYDCYSRDASMITTQEDCDRMFAELLSKRYQEEDLASQRPHFGRHGSYVPLANEEDDASMIATQDTNDYDRIIAEALSKQPEEEDLASQQPQFVRHQTYVPPVVDNIDPDYLAALPPDIQEELLRAQRMQKANAIVPACQQALPEPNAIDPTFLAALPEELRAEVFASMQPLSYVPPPDDYIPPKVLGRELIREQALQKQRWGSENDWQRRGEEKRQRDIEKMKELRLKAKTVLDSGERARLEDIIRRLSDEIVEGAKLAKSVSDTGRLRELGFITRQIVARFREERKENKTLNAQENSVDIEMQRREAEDQELEELLAQSKRDYEEEQRQNDIERQRKKRSY